jgi:hypothetical protein
VSTRRIGRAARLTKGDIGAQPGAGVSKSAVSRRFVALLFAAQPLNRQQRSGRPAAKMS